MDSSDDDAPLAVPLAPPPSANAVMAPEPTAPHQPVPVTLITGLMISLTDSEHWNGTSLLCTQAPTKADMLAWKQHG